MKLSTNHPKVREIQNCSNKGPDPFQRGGNYKNRVRSFKIFFSRTTMPEKAQIHMTAS
jgi:hypothetical protein